MEMKLMLAKLAKSHRKLKKQNKKLREVKPESEPEIEVVQPVQQVQQPPTINYNIMAPPVEKIQPTLQMVEPKKTQKIANYKRSGLMNSLRQSIMDEKRKKNLK